MELLIDHNHGQLRLAGAVIEERKEIVHDYNSRRDVEVARRYAVGTVISGGSTSRLFTASAFTPFPVGERMEWPLYGRVPYEYEPGKFRVSTHTCG